MAATALVTLDNFHGRQWAPGDKIPIETMNETTEKVLHALENSGAISRSDLSIEISENERTALAAIHECKETLEDAESILDELNENKETTQDFIEHYKSIRADLALKANTGDINAQKMLRDAQIKCRDSELEMEDLNIAIEQQGTIVDQCKQTLDQAHHTRKKYELDRLSQQLLDTTAMINDALNDLAPLIHAYHIGQMQIQKVSGCSGNQLLSPWRLNSAIGTILNLDLEHVHPYQRMDNFVEVEKSVVETALRQFDTEELPDDQSDTPID